MVVVAEVPVAFLNVKSINVEEALEINPLPKTSVVEVESSFVPNFVNGKVKVLCAELERLPFDSERPAPTVSGPTLPSAPMYGILERSAAAVIAKFVVVAAVPVAVE